MVLLLLGTCLVAAADAFAGGGEAADEKGVAFETLHRGEGSWAKPVLLLVHSPEEWDRAMERLLREGALWTLPAPEAPREVDWENESVLLASKGRCRTPGYDIEVRGLRELGGRLLVELEVRVPTGEDACAPYHPCHMITLPRSDAELLPAAVQYVVHGPDAGLPALAASAE